MTRALHRIYRRRRGILAFAAAAAAAYGVLVALVPWRFCHTEGYVLASVTVLTVIAIDAAVWRERRR